MFDLKGEVPLWRPIYDLLTSAAVDDVLTYEHLDNAAGYDVRADRGPLYQAIKNMEKDSKRTAVNVAGVGYRIARAEEHADLGKNRQKRARRQVVKGIRTVRATDREALTQEQRETNDRVLGTLVRHEGMLRNHEKRIASLERSEKAKAAAQAKKDADTELMAARIAALEEKVSKKSSLANF